MVPGLVPSTAAERRATFVVDGDGGITGLLELVHEGDRLLVEHFRVPDEEQARQDLNTKRDPVPSQTAEQRPLGRARHSPVEEEQVQKPLRVRGKQEQCKQNHVERQQLHRHVVGHVQRKDFGRVQQAHERPEHRRLGEDQKNSAEHLGAADKNLVRRRGSDRRPQHAHRRQIPVWFKQPI